ncbi:hypothetical protein [Shinella sp. M27]|uniref:hypothetical protein n=1 Tax=Shinella sp. M27 TaxID=3368614 RepID=UPI003B9FBBC2
MSEVPAAPDWSAFALVASMEVDDHGTGFAFSILNTEAALQTEAVYVWFASDGEPLRIGTSKPSVGNRLRQYPQHINRSLRDGLGPTPPHEAAAWFEIARSGPLKALAHQPPLITTVCGLIRPYLDIERHLIAQLKPRLNRSHR